jgi:hypothetical protein
MKKSKRKAAMAKSSRVRRIKSAGRIVTIVDVGMEKMEAAFKGFNKHAGLAAADIRQIMENAFAENTRRDSAHRKTLQVLERAKGGR